MNYKSNFPPLRYKRVFGLSFYFTYLFWFTLKRHHIRIMRVRTKDCFKCDIPKEVLYRCRYKELKDWVFLCGKCLNEVKTLFKGTYQYGGTWKSKKK